jgi:hypothetical protein
MLINIGILSSSCTPGIWKENVGPNGAKSFPIFFQILLIVLKKKIYCKFNERAQKTWWPIIFQIENKMTTQVKTTGSSFLREPPVRFWHFKIYVIVVQVWVWARFFQNLNLSVPVLSHFLKSKNLQSPDMVPVPCTHYAFPNAKDCVSTKF